MLSRLIDKLKLYQFRRKWRKGNAHNTTIAVNEFAIDSVAVGKGTYGAIQVLNWGTNEKMSIGSYCSIAQEVMFILNADHFINHISTYPFKVKCLGQRFEGISKGDIVVADDVWIGYRVIILSGVHIGQGAIIAAGAVVTKDVPPYAVAGGSPARVIKFRFKEEIRNELLKLDFSEINKKMVENHIDDLYQEVTEAEQFSWMARK